MLVKDHLNTWCCFLQLPWLPYGRPCSLQEILDTVHWKLMIISVTELIHFLAFFHLKNKCYAQFQVHNLKSMKEFFHTAQYSSIVLSTVFPFKPPPAKILCSDWSAHTRQNQQRSLHLHSALSNFQLPLRVTPTMNVGKLCKCVTWWYSVMSRSNGNSGGTIDEAFRAL